MKTIADLHIHSRFSMATSKEGTPENLDFWARKKGISLIGTSLSFSSSLHTGCVKSPVPISEIPFFLAQKSRLSGVPSLLVAMENLE